MKTQLLRYAPIMALLTSAATAQGAFQGFFNYAVDAQAVDLNFAPNQDHQRNAEILLETVGPGGLVVRSEVQAALGGSFANARVIGGVSPGIISLEAVAAGQSTNATGAPIGHTGSTANAAITGGLADDIQIGFLVPPAHPVFVDADLLLSADLGAVVDAVPTNNENFQRDWVEARLQEFVHVSGPTFMPLPINGTDIYAEREINADLGGTSQTFHPLDSPLRVIFQVGTDGHWLFRLNMTAELNVLVNNHDVTHFTVGNSSGYVDASHTLRWGGINKITDSVTGQEITNYTLTSDSGFDYRFPAPVPEPAGWALIAVGLMFATGCRRANPR